MELVLKEIIITKTNDRFKVDRVKESIELKRVGP